MKSDEITIRRGIQVNTDIASFSAYNAALLPDGSIEVYLTFTTDQDHEFTLHLGDTFPVRDQTWRLDRVEDAGKPNWHIALRRVK
ncbi:DUF6406 domain-containing protein [Actinoallomurus iriomotensis]|uniref:DUF6406 domain-containing protein n=1 Tax=Actinoallomurus iriomotensis TaxID=478107 RepID=UPI003D7FD022